VPESTAVAPNSRAAAAPSAARSSRGTGWPAASNTCATSLAGITWKPAAANASLAILVASAAASGPWVPLGAGLPPGVGLLLLGLPVAVGLGLPVELERSPELGVPVELGVPRAAPGPLPPRNSGDTANGTTAIFASIFGSTSCTSSSTIGGTIGAVHASAPNASESASTRARFIR
jgi:hypothetical protein